MALKDKTYGALQTYLADLLNREDLTANVPDFITLAEDDIKRELEYFVTEGNVTVSTQSTTMATTIKELRSMVPVTGSPSLDLPLKIVTPVQLAQMRALQGGVVGRPRWAAVIDGAIVVAPAPDQSYTFDTISYDELVPLTDAAPTNDVLTKATDLYVYGALMHAAPFLEDDDRIPVWEKFYTNALASLNRLRERQELGAESEKPARLPVVFG